MRIKPGKYLSEIKSCGVGRPKEGSSVRPPLFVEFDVTDPDNGEVNSIYWWGYMGVKQRPESKKHPYEISIETLLKLGLHGSDPYAIAENNLSALDTRREYELVIEDDEYNGKTRSRVRFINVPGNGGVKEVLSHKEAKAMAGFNFQGAVEAARVCSGIKDEKPVKEDEDIEDLEIPF